MLGCYIHCWQWMPQHNQCQVFATQCSVTALFTYQLLAWVTYADVKRIVESDHIQWAWTVGPSHTPLQGMYLQYSVSCRVVAKSTLNPCIQLVVFPSHWYGDQLLIALLGFGGAANVFSFPPLRLTFDMPVFLCNSIIYVTCQLLWTCFLISASSITTKKYTYVCNATSLLKCLDVVTIICTEAELLF